MEPRCRVRRTVPDYTDRSQVLLSSITGQLRPIALLGRTDEVIE